MYKRIQAHAMRLMKAFYPLAGEPDWAIFAYILGDFFYFWATFISGTGYVLIGTNNGLGNILGDFVANSSGHPVPTCDECRLRGRYFKQQVSELLKKLGRFV
jgi:hypothetical protein